MSHYVFKLPDVGEGTAEVEIIKWHVAAGDAVAEDQALVDVATDKAVVEIPSPVAGTIVAIHGNAGETLPVGAELVIFEIDGETKTESPPARTPGPAPQPLTASEREADAASARAQLSASAPADQAAVSAATAAITARSPGEKPMASPAVRQRARDMGILLQYVSGSGAGGRIMQADLDAFVAGTVPPAQRAAHTPPQPGRGAAAPQPPAAQRDAIEEHKVIGVRRKIAEHMQEAKRRIPHFSYIEEVDMTALESLRAHLNDKYGANRPRLTLLPFIVKALVRALPAHPQINARYDDDAGVVRRYREVHAGIATQTPNGLLVPVLRHAGGRELWACAVEISRLAAKAREGKATRDELGGSTITVTSLGAIGGVAFTPIINYPEVAIVGVNKLVERPVIRGDRVVARSMMNLSSSFDHRVVDGWAAAQFVQELKQLLEQPATLFLEGADVP